MLSPFLRPSYPLFLGRSLFLVSCWTFGRSFSVMSPRTTRTGSTVVVSPSNPAQQSALVVICHGLGDTAEGFVDVAEMLAAKLPYTKFILPTAEVQPVTLNGGMRMNSWYDIVGLDERANEACHGIEASQKRLLDLLQAEHEATGLPYSRMVLAGFSQGGALSLYTGLQLAQPLAGIVVLSGYLPAAAKVSITAGLERTPVWHGHGTSDMVVQYHMAEKSREACLAKGLQDYTLKTYPIGHTVSPDEIAAVLGFLQEVLPDDPSCRIRLKDPAEMSVKELKQAIRDAGLAHKAVGFMEKAEFVKLLQDYRKPS